jgi:hypothetical protein
MTGGGMEDHPENTMANANDTYEMPHSNSEAPRYLNEGKQV